MNRTEKAHWIGQGIVESSLEQVAALLFDLQSHSMGERQAPLFLEAIQGFSESLPLIVEGGPHRFNALMGDEPSQHRLTIEVDEAHRSITLKGEWWYRGEYSLRPHEKGCLITYRVFNMAGGPTRLLATFLARRESAAYAKQLQALLHRIGRRLKCATYILQPQ